jgi:hypothetical protein
VTSPFILVAVLASTVATQVPPAPAPTPTPSTSAESEPDPCLRQDAKGQTYTVCFDPGNRVALLASPGAMLQTSGLSSELELDLGLRLRRSRASRTHEKLTWTVEQHFLEGGVMLKQGTPPAWDVTAYQGIYLRHLEEGFILIPTSTPIRIPFPFDISISPSFGRWERTSPSGFGDRLEIVRCTLLLDAARDPTGIQRLAFGPELSYALARSPTNSLQNELEPLSGGQVRLRNESDDGLWAAQADLHVGWLIVPGRASGIDSELVASLERVLIAVNDEPLSLRLALHGRERRLPPVREELIASLGVVAAYDL